MARPKAETNEMSQENLNTNSSVIFVGTGVVFGGKMNGNKPIARFNKNYLFETDDQKIIKKLDQLGYERVNEIDIRRLMEASPYNYQQMIREMYLRKHEPKKVTKGNMSQLDVDLAVGRITQGEYDEQMKRLGH